MLATQPGFAAAAQAATCACSSQRSLVSPRSISMATSWVDLLNQPLPISIPFHLGFMLRDMVSNRVVPAPDDRRAFMVVAGNTEQSWVDPANPLRLEFEYVQRIAEILDLTVLSRPAAERVRIVHVGGGGLTLPRYVAARRPHTAQIVLEPDEELTAEVRARLPLPRNSGIKIRAHDGRSGVAQLPDAYADALILDAFAAASVPAELATVEFFTDVRRALRPGGLLIMNLTDQAPFGWSKRCLAALFATQPQLVASAEVPVWKGRRFGNLVAVAGPDLPETDFSRALARAPFPYRLLAGRELVRFIGAATPFTELDAEPSPPPAWSRTWFS